ncbi:protein kinase [Actinoplanes sp. NPDC051494]|uniref:serine/threonine-protein kinase n=1 Tax=Actinoplanes sp. NPDC051494 TaxID=3363907 RepID=UPI00378A1F9A
MPLRPGDPVRLGDYELLSRLGQGGMGTVFRGRAADGTTVAVKMVRPEFAGDEEFRGRFRSEVTRAQQVPSFSTAAVLDADPDHDPPYLVVEYVDGPALNTLVQERGPLTGHLLQGVAVGIATALTAIHGAGVIHRDLKPGNVLIALGGVKVIDFGIARAFEATSMHTRTDQMVGTVAYMAPERFDPAYGQEVTPAADVFAWGAVVTYAATGRTPFTADSPAAAAVRILTQPPDLTGVPAPLRALVEASLAKYPQQRPTARELLDALLGSSTQRSPSVPVAVRPPDDTAGTAWRVHPGSLDAATGNPGAARPAPVSSASRPTTGQGGADGLRVASSRSRVLRRAAPAAVAGLVLLGGGLGVLHQANRFGGEPSASDRGAGSGSAPASETAGPATTPADAQTAILAGDRRFSIQLTTGNRYFMIDGTTDELDLSDGTGPEAEFVLKPVGVRYMIRSLAGEGYAGDDYCLGVDYVPGRAASPVVGATCAPTAATLFAMVATGDKDAKGRPTYSIKSDEHGWLMWDAERKRSDVTEVGEALFADKYTLVDRGEL